MSDSLPVSLFHRWRRHRSSDLKVRSSRCSPVRRTSLERRRLSSRCTGRLEAASATAGNRPDRTVLGCYVRGVAASEDPIEILRLRMEKLQAEHSKIAASVEFVAALDRLNTITFDFMGTFRAAWIGATREPTWNERIFWVGTDDFIAGALGINMHVSNGIRWPARRELRFLLESAIKYLYVDEQFARGTPLATRLEFLKRKVPSSSIDPISDIKFDPVLGDQAAALQAAIWPLYGTLSEAAHLSARQVDEHLDAIARGAYLGFETAADIERTNDLLESAYDILIPFALLALGPASAADFLDVAMGQPEWTFAETQFTNAAAAVLLR